SVHQRESDRLLLSQPLAPGVEGVFRKPALLAELLHRNSAALLLADSLTPLISLRGHLLLRDRLVHEATMQHCPPVGKRGSSDAYHSPSVSRLQTRSCR